MAIDCAVGCIDRIVWSAADFSHKAVHPFNKVDLELEKLSESAFDIIGKNIKTTHSGVGTFLHLRPQEVVVTGQ